jgi:hypothetical protein
MIDLTTTMRAHWHAVRAQAEAALAELDRAAEAEPPPPAEPEPRMMKLQRYLVSRDIPESTLHAYLAEGLPAKGAGRSRRILVIEADQWLARRRGGRDG